MGTSIIIGPIFQITAISLRKRHHHCIIVCMVDLPFVCYNLRLVMLSHACS